MKKFLFKKGELLEICKSETKLANKAALIENALNEEAIGGYLQAYSQFYGQVYGQAFSKKTDAVIADIVL